MPFWSIEPVLWRLRIKPIVPFVTPGGVLVDIGCGNPPLTINLLKDQMEHCFGLDTEVEDGEYENVTLIKVSLKKKIPLPDNLAKIVIMAAVLEHLDYPQAVANELYRLLTPGGELLITVPTPKNKPLLEFLAKFQVVRPKMIAQHKNYFTKTDLKEIFIKAGFRVIEISPFQFGFNTFLRAVK